MTGHALLLPLPVAAAPGRCGALAFRAHLVVDTSNNQLNNTLPDMPPAAVGVGAVAMLMSKDIKQSSAMLRRNMRHIRTWLEEQGAAAE